MKNYRNIKGFTLIELMVVISIIVILSTIVYSSISKARDKAADREAQGYLSNALVQAKLFYFANGESFKGVCDNKVVGGVKPINDVLVSAGKSVKITTSVTGGAGAGNKITCHDDKNYWVAEVPLRKSSPAAPRMFCADSTGAQIEKINILSLNQPKC